MVDLKKEGFGILKGVLLVVCLIFIISYFKLAIWETALLLILVQIAFMVIRNNFSWKTLIKRILMIVGVLILFRMAGYFGILGYSFVLISCSLIIILGKWKKYISVKQTIEEKIWGKPLKEFKSGKEIPKIRVSK